MSDFTVGLLSTSQSYTGLLGTPQPDDLYYFSLNQPTNLNIGLGGSGADFQLLDSSGNVLQTASSTGRNLDAFYLHNLMAGDYVLRVFSLDGETNYDLKLAVDRATEQQSLESVDSVTGLPSDEEAIPPTFDHSNAAAIYPLKSIRPLLDVITGETDDNTESNISQTQTVDSLNNIDDGTLNPSTSEPDLLIENPLNNSQPTEPDLLTENPLNNSQTSDRDLLAENSPVNSPITEPVLAAEKPIVTSPTSEPILTPEKPTVNSTTATTNLSSETIPTNFNPFASGTFKVDDSGQVGIDYLFDGGKFRSELAIFSMKGMEQFIPGTPEFNKEVARRALSNSSEGYIVISKATEGARFTGQLGEKDWNGGRPYQGVKTFLMNPGDEFGVIMVPNGTLKQVFDNPNIGGQNRPLFSMATANPVQGFHLGQIADITGEGNTFSMEDMRFDSWTDRDYNDLIFQVRGAVGKAALMNDVVAAGKDWRTSDLGQALVEYAKAYITPEPMVDDVGSDSNNLGNDGAVSPEFPVEGLADSNNLGNDGAVFPELPLEGSIDSGSVSPELPLEGSIDSGFATPDWPVEGQIDSSSPELPVEAPVEPISINKPIEPTPTPAIDTEVTKSLPITAHTTNTEVTEPSSITTPATDEAIKSQPVATTPATNEATKLQPVVTTSAPNELTKSSSITTPPIDAEVIKFPSITAPTTNTEITKSQPVTTTPAIDEVRKSQPVKTTSAPDIEVIKSLPLTTLAPDIEVTKSQPTNAPTVKPAIEKTAAQFSFPPTNQPLVVVADTGVAANNPNIDYKQVTSGHDYVGNDNDSLLAPGEGSQHGTHILGSIQSINPQAPILAIRTIGSGRWSDAVIEAVDRAKQSGQPNAVVNLSLDLAEVTPSGIITRYELTPQERAAIEYARQNHVLLVVAAGNDGGAMSALGQASQEFDNILTVGAAEQVNPQVSAAKGFDRAEYSSYGMGVGILAEGGTPDKPVLSTVEDGLGTMAGSSVAAAKVTAAVSQVWAANPRLSYRQVIEILKSTATDLKIPNWDEQTGAGLLNMKAAVYLAKATPPENYNPEPLLIPTIWDTQENTQPIERAVSITEAIEAEYLLYKHNLGNPTGPIVEASSSPQGTAGKWIGYQNGTIHWTPQYGAVAVWIDLQREYNEHGGSGGWLGFPTKHEYDWKGGRRTDFEGGYIYWDGQHAEAYHSWDSPPGITSQWQTAIDSEYQQNKNILGNPVSGYLDALRSPQGTTGKYRIYQNGTVHWSPQYGAIALGFDVPGGVYAQNGGSGGWLGFPTKREYDWNGGRRTDFEGGYVYWDGQQIKAYRLGELPPSPTSVKINGYTVSDNFYPVFKNYQNPLGNPVSGVINNSNGTSYQRFQNGSIISSKSGTFPVYGSILQTYSDNGGLNGELGVPTSEAKNQGNGFLKQTFTGGYIIWNGQKALAYKVGTGQPISAQVPTSQPEKVYNLGKLYGTQSFNHSLTSLNPANRYSFNLDQKSNLKVDLKNLSSDDIDVVLTDSKGQVIYRSQTSGMGPESINVNLDPGSYTVRVYPKNSKSFSSTEAKYQLNLSATSLYGSTSSWQVKFWNNKNLSGVPVWESTAPAGELLFNAGLGAPPNTSGIPSDNFSGRWETTSNFEGGLYDFISQADDGVRVYIDGVKVVDKWQDQPFARNDAYVMVPKGNHKVVVEYFENTGAAANTLRWEPSGFQKGWTGPLRPVGYDGGAVHGTYVNTYQRNGSMPVLGYPTNNVHPWENGYTQDFEGGSDGKGAIMKSNANDNSYWVGGKIWDKFLELGGAKSLGYPTTDRIAIKGGLASLDKGGGVVQQFSGNVGIPTKIWLSKYGAHPTWGAIGNKYESLGGANSFLGFPISREQGIGNGWVIQDFEGGYMLWHPQYGATVYDPKAVNSLPPDSGHGSTGNWTVKFWNNKDMAGTPAWTGTQPPGELRFAAGTGAPVGTRGISEDNFSARWETTSDFDGGFYNFITSADDGMRVYVDGVLVNDKWGTNNAWERHDAYIAIPKGKHNIRIDYFEQTGAAGITSRWEPSGLMKGWTGEFRPVGYDGGAVHGTYVKTYQRNGAIAALGYPTNKVHPWGNGYTQDFEGGSDGKGAIMKSNANDLSYWVGGDFWKTFLDFGAVDGLLKYPTSDRYPTKGGFRQDFQGGAIFKSQHGTFPVYGGIGGKYLSLGGEKSFLGFPTSKEIGLGDGWIIQNFENGYILYKEGIPTIAYDTKAIANLPPDSGHGSTSNWRVDFWNNQNMLGKPTWSRYDKSGELRFAAGQGGPLDTKGVQEDHFSGRWVTTSYFEGGIYNFINKADDGVRVYVDGKLVIDKWNDSPFEEKSNTAFVSQGYHNIQVEYFENRGSAANILRWEKLNPLNEWAGEFFNNQNLSGQPAGIRGGGTGSLNKDWGTGHEAGVPIGDDYFSDRWTATRLFEQSGVYELNSQSDDGVRIWVDDKLVLDQWFNKIADNKVLVPLEQGYHKIRVEHFDGVGYARTKLEWNKVPGVVIGKPLQFMDWTSPSSNSSSTIRVENWVGEYFNNRDLSGAPVLTRLDGRGDKGFSFDWKEGSPDARINRDDFSARWTTYAPLAEGNYTFKVGSDDGVRLYIDGQKVLDQWTERSFTNNTVTVPLPAGFHKLQLEYFERGGGAAAKLDWNYSPAPYPFYPALDNIGALSESFKMGYNQLVSQVGANRVGSPISAMATTQDYNQTRLEPQIMNLFKMGQSWSQVKNLLTLQGQTSIPIKIGDVWARIPIEAIQSLNVDKLDGRVFGVQIGNLWLDPNVSLQTQEFRGDQGVGALLQKPTSSRLRLQSNSLGDLTFDNIYVFGKIWEAYKQAGGPNGLGYPISPQKDLGNGAYELQLPNGKLFWAPGMTNATYYEYTNGSLTIPADSWRGEFFNNQYWAGDPVVVRSDSNPGGNLDKDWGLGSPAPGVQADYFSARWTSQRPFDRGTYRFVAEHDDGFTVEVNGQAPIDKMMNLAAQTTGYATFTQPNQYWLQVKHREYGGDARAKLGYEKASDYVVGLDPSNGKTQAIIDAFSRNGGYDAVGVPLNDVHTWGNGIVQDFNGGSHGRGIVMNRNGSGTAYHVYGDIWNVYLNRGGPGKFGYPTTDVFYDGHGNTAQEFEGNRITRKSNGETFVGGYINGHLLPDDFYRVWRQYDLGTPTSEVQTHSSGAKFQMFDKPGLGTCSIISSQYGTFPLYGAIRNYYVSTTGGLNGPLGAPKSGEYSWGGGTRQDFAGGYILWKNGTAVGYKPDGLLLYPSPSSGGGGGSGGSTQSIVEALRTAIIGQESGYNYGAVNPDSGALGFAQIMPYNVGPWSKEALGYSITTAQFLSSPDLQLKIIDYKLNQYYQKAIVASGGDLDIAVRRVASAWYSGHPEWYTSTTPQYYNGNQYPSIAEYTLSVLAKFHQVYKPGGSPTTGSGGGAGGSYNRSAAVEYAYQYSNSRNPKYPDYSYVGGNCANFVSQCLIKGGLLPDRTDGPFEYINADGLTNYLLNQGLAQEVGSISELEPGDVIAYSWDGGPIMDHVAIYRGDNTVASNTTDGIFEWSMGIGAKGKVKLVHIKSGYYPFNSDIYDNDPAVPQEPYWRFNEAVKYMSQEMTNNIKSPQALEMKGLLTNGLFLEASIDWFKLVNDGQLWDHKKEKIGEKKLPTRLHLKGTNYYFPFPGDTEHEYYYDIWSNIHYGYVGRAIGFHWTWLQLGASANDISKGNIDEKDVNAIELGINLWDWYGPNMTEDNLRQAILVYKDNLSRQNL